MRPKRFPFLLRHLLTTLAIAVTLIPAAQAQPKFKILHTVPGGLFGGVTFDAKGNLYGGTGGGGDHNQGTIFELSPGAQGWSLKTLHSFDGYDGGGPNGGLIFDAAGNLFATSPSGGIYNGGAAFEMTPNNGGWTFKVLYDFCVQYHCPDGSSPSGLVRDGLGNLYGTGNGGGPYAVGVVFKITPGVSEWNETVLQAFDGPDGSAPYDSLIFDKANNL